eukprot:3617725-Pyramimonas_sp.AAC.1
MMRVRSPRVTPSISPKGTWRAPSVRWQNQCVKTTAASSWPCAPPHSCLAPIVDSLVRNMAEAGGYFLLMHQRPHP